MKTLEQKKEILNNAPEWATHYLVADFPLHCDEERYCVKIGVDYFSGDLLDYKYDIINGFWRAEFCLDDLREEVKAIEVVEAVNYFREGVEVDIIGDYNVTYICAGFDCKFVRSGFEHESRIVCTREEYKECVKELSEAAWMTDGPHSYDAHKAWWADSQEDEAVEWKNGDDVEYNGRLIGAAIGIDSNSSLVVELNDSEAKDFGRTFVSFSLKFVSKPETAEQKAARVREEKAKALFELRQECGGGIKSEWDWQIDSVKDTYRKMIDAGVKVDK